MRLVQILLVALLCPDLQSQPPTPTPTKNSAVKKQNTPANQQQVGSNNEQTEPGVTVINQFYPQYDSRDKEKSEDRQNSNTFLEKVSTALLAFFTFLLFVATAVLCYIARLQWRTMVAHKQSLEAMAAHMENGLAETTKAANAARDSAKTSEQTFVASHRPRLTVRFMSADGIEQVNPISGRFLLFNTGDTKAKLIRGHSEVVIYVGNLPATTPYEGNIGDPFVDVELIPGDSVPVTFPTVPQEQEPGEIRDYDLHRDGNIYVIGWIAYSDPSGRVHRKGFAYRYNRITKRFQREPDEDYEYDD
jgi:hypothetical protein